MNQCEKKCFGECSQTQLFRVFAGVALAASLLFTACGDDNSSSVESNNLGETVKSSASTNTSDDYDECYNNTGITRRFE